MGKIILNGIEYIGGEADNVFAPVIYSDVERVIGVWRDNKPLYAKTWVLTVPSATGTYSFNEATPNLENVVHTEYSLWGLGERGQVPWYNPATILFSEQTASYIEFYFASSNYAGQKIYFTSYYTKTTDVAGSGDYNTYGVPTVHYDTNEQVVGTWINSKPLYQKTLILRENGVDLYTYSGYSYLNCLPNDIEFIDIVQMFMPRSGGDAGYVDVRNNYNEVQVVPNISNQSIYLYDNHNPTDTILTIQYTKSTD